MFNHKPLNMIYHQGTKAPRKAQQDFELRRNHLNHQSENSVYHQDTKTPSLKTDNLFDFSLTQILVLPSLVPWCLGGEKMVLPCFGGEKCLSLSVGGVA